MKTGKIIERLDEIRTYLEDSNIDEGYYEKWAALSEAMERVGDYKDLKKENKKLRKENESLQEQVEYLHGTIDDLHELVDDYEPELD